MEKNQMNEKELESVAGGAFIQTNEGTFITNSNSVSGEPGNAIDILKASGFDMSRLIKQDSDYESYRVPGECLGEVKKILGEQGIHCHPCVTMNPTPFRMPVGAV